MTHPSSRVPGSRTDWLALGAALVTVVLWASAFVGIRAVVDDFGPASLAFGRLLVGAIALGIVVAVYRLVDGGRRRFDYWRIRHPESAGSSGVWFLVYVEAIGLILCALCMIGMGVGSIVIASALD